MSEQEPTEPREPTEEELRAALEEQMRNIRVEDVILQTVVTLINLGARRLGLARSPDEAGEKDPDQARLAIEGARSLMGLVTGEGVQPLRDALAQLQMAYVRETQAEPESPETADRRPQTAEEKGPDAEAEAEREKARSKIWTPPGT